MSVPPCTIPTTGSFWLKDFQGLCLTVDNSAGFFSTVFADFCELRLPALPQQTVWATWISSGSHMVDIVMQWSLAPVNHGAILVSGLSQAAGELVLLADTDGQAITAGNTGFGFNITCVPIDFNTVTLVDNLVGTETTLTSTQVSVEKNSNLDPPAQVIFQPLAPNPFQIWNEQIWSIQTLD